MPFWDRTARVLGEAGVERLAASRVALFGLGGVGGHACEALARAGVGALALFDADSVEETNLNRQLVALRSTLGQPKVEAMARRVADINPDCRVETYPIFYGPGNGADFPLGGYDYVVDAVDTVSAKLELARRAREAGVPLISAMGAGDKLHPERLELADIYETSGCPLARVMRRELRKLGIERLKVVYSREEPRRAPGREPDEDAGAGAPRRKPPPGSTSFVPGAAGLILAGAVVRDLLGIED